MNYSTIQYKISQDIAGITLNNPPGNQTSLLFFNELHHICTHLSSNKALNGVIIDSTGRHFSSGAVVSELLEEIQQNTFEAIPSQMEKNLTGFQILRNLNIPVVALIKGICYGSGFELALCAKYRIATKNALMCFPEISFGLMPGLGGIYSLTNLIGKARTTELVLTGRSINAEEALTLGLLESIHPEKSLHQEAIQLIRAKSRTK